MLKLCLLLLLSFTNASASEIVKWANLTYTAYNVPNKTDDDLVNLQLTYEDIQKTQWFKGSNKVMLTVFVPIFLAVGSDANDYELEMFNAACYYNRTYDEGKYYYSLELDAEKDPCIEYGKYLNHDAVDASQTVQYVTSQAELIGRYRQPRINKTPCIMDRFSITKSSFDYEAYIEELQKYISVSDTRVSSEHYKIEHKQVGNVFCKHHNHRCYMEKDFFITRCLTLFSHFKNMKIQ